MKQTDNRVESTLLRRINERRLLEAIQQHGPSSRAALTRVSGLTAPTVSKAVEALLKRGLIEELAPAEQALGRPGRLVRMAAASACVLGAVIDADTCCVVATGLDGMVTEDRTIRFPTPTGYAGLLDSVEESCRTLIHASGAVVHGVGLSVPGLVNERLREIVFSPNLHLLDKHNPARDLEARLGVPCVLVQESDALVLGEWLYGDARGLDDFAVLDAATDRVLPVVKELVASAKGERLTLVGGGGGAEAIVPHLARRARLEHEIAPDAEVISAIGAAIGVVQDVVERSMTDPGESELDALRRAAFESVARMGADPATIEVLVEVEVRDLPGGGRAGAEVRVILTP